jgi:type IV secretory pathway VirB2 component (pilin)
MGHEPVINSQRALEGATPAGGAAVERFLKVVNVIIAQVAVVEKSCFQSAPVSEVAFVDIEEEIGPVTRDIAVVVCLIIKIKRFL